MKKILLAIIFALLCACAKNTPLPPQQESSSEKAWRLMTEISERDNHPSRAQFSLRFGKEGDTRRVTGLLWSNDYQTVRLDIMAGVGVTMAKILDTPGYFLMVVPGENKAFEHSGHNRPLLRIGAPLPFNLSQLAQLIAGDYAAVFGQDYDRLKTDDGKSTAYILSNPADSILEIASSGLPSSWKTGSWNLRFKYADNETTPSSLRLTGTDGKIAVLLIKNREYPDQSFTNEQMELPVPAGAQIFPLSRYKP